MSEQLLGVNAQSPYVFDDPQEFFFSLKGQKFVMVEASEDAVRVYTNSMVKKTKLGPNGRPAAYDDMDDIESELLFRCVYLIDEKDGGRKPLKLETVRSWPDRHCEFLVKKLKQMSHMDEDAEETIDAKIAALQEQKAALAEMRQEVKNEQPGTPTS